MKFCYFVFVHTCVVPHLDYCSTLYAGFPAGQLGCLDQVLRAAACLIVRIPRSGQISVYMQEVLRWLPLQVTYRVSVLGRRCLEGLAPLCLRELCCPTTDVQHRPLASHPSTCSLDG